MPTLITLSTGALLFTPDAPDVLKESMSGESGFVEITDQAGQKTWVRSSSIIAMTETP